MEQSFTEGASLQTQFWVNLILFPWEAIKPWLSCFFFSLFCFFVQEKGEEPVKISAAGMSPHTHDFRLDHGGNVELFFLAAGFAAGLLLANAP